MRSHQGLTNSFPTLTLCPCSCIFILAFHPSVDVLCADCADARLTSFHRRKYFSNLERLQIAHYSAANVYCNSTPRPRTSATRPTTSHSYAPSVWRSRKQNNLQPTPIGAKSEVDFYLSLPDKVRRQQFSEQEQIRIQQHVNPHLLPRSPQGSRRPSSASSLKESRRGSFAARADFKVPVVGLSRPSADSMNCFESKPTRVGSRRSSRKSSLQRGASVRRPSSSTLSPQSPSSVPTICTPTSAVFSHHRQLSTKTANTSVMRPSMDSTLSVDATATYYQDPEARMKLREYLASPQKFDEAVAFGFPSMSTRASTYERNSYQQHMRSTSGNDAQTFLRDDMIEFIDDYSSDISETDSACFTESPVTPASGQESMSRMRPYGSSIFAELDNSDLPSLKFKFEGMREIIENPIRERLFDPLANREMTLRMTLTRPELRATEAELYGWEKENENEKPKEEADPLALEALDLSDDVTGQNGAFAVKTANGKNRRSGVFKKFFDTFKTERKH